jgi:hypothetical protein
MSARQSTRIAWTPAYRSEGKALVIVPGQTAILLVAGILVHPMHPAASEGSRQPPLHADAGARDNRLRPAEVMAHHPSDPVGGFGETRHDALALVPDGFEPFGKLLAIPHLLARPGVKESAKERVAPCPTIKLCLVPGEALDEVLRGLAARPVRLSHDVHGIQPVLFIA